MKTYKITKSDIDETGLYIGDINTDEEIDGSLFIEADLGRVRFTKSLRVRGEIRADAGSEIIAGWCFEAGWIITAGECITAGLSITDGS